MSTKILTPSERMVMQDHIAEMSIALAAKDAEIEKLKAQLVAAPHQSWCKKYAVIGGKCNCWKSEDK